MNELNKVLGAVVTVAASAAWLSVAEPAQAAPSSKGHHHHAHHHHHGHHHHNHQGVRYWRGGRWVYLNNVGPVYNVYYRSEPVAPWVLYGPYGTQTDAGLEAAYLRSLGYDVFVR